MESREIYKFSMLRYRSGYEDYNIAYEENLSQIVLEAGLRKYFPWNGKNRYSIKRE